jgi:peptidoglycan/LPS O-acetylase OafA/YrhL
MNPDPLATTAAWRFVIRRLALQSFEWSFFPTLHDPRLNPPLWTIPFELGCYVAFAALAVVLRRWWVAALCLGLVVAFVLKGFGAAVADPSSLTENADWMLFGAFFAVGALYSAVPALRTWKALAASIGLGVFAYIAGSQFVGLVIAIPAVAIQVGIRSWPVLRRAGRFGDLSYGVYLWGWPVQQVVASTLGVQVGFWTLLTISLPCVLGLAALSWHLVEKRALSMKPSSAAVWPRWATLELK